MTTTMSALFDLPEPLDVVGMEAVSEAARSATVAQNKAGATRLEAAHVIVEQMARLAEESEEVDRARGGRGLPAYARLDPQSRARAPLAAAGQRTGWPAPRRVTPGVQIHTRLPRLRQAVGRGLVPEQLAIDLACRLAGVPDASVAAVEREVVAGIVADVTDGDRPSRSAVESAVDRAVEQHDPGAAEDAPPAASRSRRVRFRPTRNGMATLWATLPVAAAEFLRQRIEGDAQAAAAVGERGTIDQLRADALAALAVYTPAGATTVEAGPDGEPMEVVEAVPFGGLPRPGVGNATAGGQSVRISVIAATARGLPNRVEFVHGAYSSFEWLCRELMDGDDQDQDEVRVRFEVVDPAPGALDSPDHALRYVLTPAMVERIRLRDGTCRHPGCSVAAAHCDIDHVIAFNTTEPELGGPSTEWNLVCLCRKHHLEKTFGHNAYRPGPLGELVIITDTGHEHRTRPSGPLARAREQIRHDAWNTHLERLIAEDGHLTNPPGISRRRRPPIPRHRRRSAAASRSAPRA